MLLRYIGEIHEGLPNYKETAAALPGGHIVNHRQEKASHNPYIFTLAALAPLPPKRFTPQRRTNCKK